MEIAYAIIAAIVIVVAAVFFLRGKDEKIVLSASLKRQQTLDDALAAHMQSLLAQGKKDEAIRLVTDRGVPREAATGVVDAIAKVGTLGNSEISVATNTITLSRDDTAEVMKHIKQGKKVEAIKLIREKTGIGLKEAKDIADQLG